MRLILSLLLFCSLPFHLWGNEPPGGKAVKNSFVTIKGQDLLSPDGSKLLIRGTNLGNWLNPEGYMFKFSKTNSPRFINEMFCEMVGPDFTAQFWQAFKDHYITREDFSSLSLRVVILFVYLFTISCLRMRIIWA